MQSDVYERKNQMFDNGEYKISKYIHVCTNMLEYSVYGLLESLINKFLILKMFRNTHIYVCMKKI